MTYAFNVRIVKGKVSNEGHVKLHDDTQQMCSQEHHISYTCSGHNEGKCNPIY